MTDYESNIDLNTFVTTTRGLNRDNNDRSTHKEGTNNAIEDYTHSSSKIVEPDTTTVIPHKNSVQEPRKATSTESVAVQTTATVSVVDRQQR